MEAEAAARKYQELTGIGGWYPKDPALLSWRSQEQLLLQVFPCPPKQPKTIEYTLEMPMTYGEGRYHLALPRMGTLDLAASALVAPVHAGDVLYVDGQRAAPGASVRLDGDGVEIALVRRARGGSTSGSTRAPRRASRSPASSGRGW